MVSSVLYVVTQKEIMDGTKKHLPVIILPFKPRNFTFHCEKNVALNLFQSEAHDILQPFFASFC